MQSNYPEADFYCVGDKDFITAESVYEAVQEWYQDCWEDDTYPDDLQVEVQGWNKQTISLTTKCPIYWLEYIVENLDENYGCEETWGDYALSDEAKEYWDKFVACVIKEYPVTQLKEAGKPFMVNVKEVLGD